MRGIVLDIEHRLARNLHAPLAPGEHQRILQPGSRIEPDLGAVLQLHAQVLPRRHFERRRPPRPLFDPVVGKHPGHADADDRHGGQLRGITHDAAQRNATQRNAARRLLRWRRRQHVGTVNDRSGHHFVQLVQFAHMRGIGVEPVEHLLHLVIGRRIFQIFIDKFRIHLSLRLFL